MQFYKNKLIKTGFLSIRCRVCNAKTIISSLSGFFINSKREVQQILSNSFIRKNGFNKEQISVTCVWKY